MKLGAEPKKVAFLGVLVVIAIYFLVSPSSDGPPRPAAGIRVPAQQAADVPMGRPAQVVPARTSSRQGRVLSDFKPSMKPKRPEDRPDPMTVDPTLQMDKLARLQTVNVVGMHRSLFEFGQAPPSPAAVQAALKRQVIPTPVVQPQPPPPAFPVAAAAPPPPPPIPMKFYGYVTPNSAGTKRAFFLEGEDIHVVREGDVVKRRYKIIRIGVNSVVVEDTEFKNQQTLPLEEQPG